MVERTVDIDKYNKPSDESFHQASDQFYSRNRQKLRQRGKFFLGMKLEDYLI